MKTEFIARLCSDSCAVCHDLRIMISVKIPPVLALRVYLGVVCTSWTGKSMQFKYVGCFLKCNPAFSPFSPLMEFPFEWLSNVSLIYSCTKCQTFILHSMFLKINFYLRFSSWNHLLWLLLFVCSTKVVSLDCVGACVSLLVLMLFDRKVQQAIEQEDGVGPPVTLHHHHHQGKLTIVVSAL